MEWRMVVEKMQKRVIECLDKIQREAESFLETVPPDAKEAFLALDNSQDIAVIADTSNSKVQRAEHTQAVLLQEKVKAAHQIMLVLSVLDNHHERIDEIDPWLLAHAMLTIGNCYGIMNRVDLAISKDFHEMIHAQTTVLKRYGEDREDYALAIQEAEEYWTKGGKDLHHVVAKRLAKKYRLKISGLKKKLAPIAKRYGRCFGVPGVKKII